MNKIMVAFLVLLPFTGLSQAKQKWKLQSDGSIAYVAEDNIAYNDHIEMGGEYVASVLRYGVKQDGSFVLERSVVWPMLRTIPNNTHASLTRKFAVDFMSLLMVDETTIKEERVKELKLDGTLTVQSEYAVTYHDLIKGVKRYPILNVKRQVFTSMNKPMLCERYTITNIIDRPVSVTVPAFRNEYHTEFDKGVNGVYNIVVKLDTAGTSVLQPGESMVLGATIQAYSTEKGEVEQNPSVSEELALRNRFVDEMWNNLVLETPDEIINRTFAFSKIRASESIYRTAGGLMHGPGGEAYYAAIWANDESEYVAPFFPLLGYQLGNESTVNAFRLYSKYMNADFTPVPSSIIAEGKDTWQGAGDCGDAAMLAYGGSRYALARGDKKEAYEIWPLIEWCLEYCNRKLNKFGVVMSDSDELEGRFPSGNANILVSSMYYDALLSASYLAEELGRPKQQVAKYRKHAKALSKAIESYFGANVEGFDTYAYFKGNTQLRSWICAPLFAGIKERAAATTKALFTRLWTENGLLSQSDSDIFWDRSTLSALRAVLAVGETEEGVHYLKQYAAKRLLGDHVPYPIEAWPEGNQRHLSGESALYGRVITEGLFGIRPVGFKSFNLAPRLPAAWDAMVLKKIRGFGDEFDIEVSRSGQQLIVNIRKGRKLLQKHVLRDGNDLTIVLE